MMSTSASQRSVVSERRSYGHLCCPAANLLNSAGRAYADQRTALLESEEADTSIRLIEALGGGFGAASNANSVFCKGDRCGLGG